MQYKSQGTWNDGQSNSFGCWNIYSLKKTYTKIQSFISLKSKSKTTCMVPKNTVCFAKLSLKSKHMITTLCSLCVCFAPQLYYSFVVFWVLWILLFFSFLVFSNLNGSFQKRPTFDVDCWLKALIDRHLAQATYVSCKDCDLWLLC